MSQARPAVLLLVAVVLASAACTERRLMGDWESVDTPKRTLSLQADHTFSLRFSGKTLGFISELAGPERGTWAVASGKLVLTYPSGKAESWPVDGLASAHVDLAGQRWVRVVPRPAP